MTKHNPTPTVMNNGIIQQVETLLAAGKKPSEINVERDFTPVQQRQLDDLIAHYDEMFAKHGAKSAPTNAWQALKAGLAKVDYALAFPVLTKVIACIFALWGIAKLGYVAKQMGIAAAVVFGLTPTLLAIFGAGVCVLVMRENTRMGVLAAFLAVFASLTV